MTCFFARLPQNAPDPFRATALRDCKKARIVRQPAGALADRLVSGSGVEEYRIGVKKEDETFPLRKKSGRSGSGLREAEPFVLGPVITLPPEEETFYEQERA
jgi:hypothetical protein